MIQEILKEYDEELPKAFHRGKETMPEFYRAFLEKSLKRVEEEAFKRGCEMGARSSFKIVEDLTT